MRLAEFYEAARRCAEHIDDNDHWTVAEMLEGARLWNTVCYYTELQRTPEGQRFFELGRDQLLLRTVKALNMVASRGMSFRSDEYDFTIGGVLSERFRHSIEELEAARATGAATQRKP